MTREELNPAAVTGTGRTQLLPAARDALEAELADTQRRALHAEMQTLRDWQLARQTVAHLAHAINQPLASVAVLCEAVSRMVADGTGQTPLPGPAARLAAALQQLADETERAGALVRQLTQAVRPPGITPGPLSAAPGQFRISATRVEEGVMADFTVLDDGAGETFHFAMPTAN